MITSDIPKGVNFLREFSRAALNRVEFRHLEFGLHCQFMDDSNPPPELVMLFAPEKSTSSSTRGVVNNHGADARKGLQLEQVSKKNIIVPNSCIKLN